MPVKITSKVEQQLQKDFSLSYHEIEKLVKEKKNIDFLNNYRGALSLWAEYTEDTKNRLIVTLDGRDTAWKWSNIKRVTEYFNGKRWQPKEFDIPTIEEKYEDNWFKRYSQFFPEEWTTTFYDRSWYNRVFVEPAMSFCTQQEYEWFMSNVQKFEKEQIIDEGIDFIKVYLSITKATQKRRLDWRKTDMRSWKSSKVDEMAQEKWNYYTLAKMKALEFTDTVESPWFIIDSNEKFLSATEIIKHMIRTTDEVASLIENELSIDLNPNPEITRNWKQELKRMEELGEIAKAKDSFIFAEAA